MATIVENLRSSPLRESYCPESVPKLNVMEFIQHYILIGKSKKYVFILLITKKTTKYVDGHFLHALSYCI